MDLVTITNFLNWFLMIALPILLGIFLTIKFQLGWRIWLIGASTFILSQIFHLPFNKFILNPLLVNIQQTLPEVTATLIIAILLGLSAGIFEELSRFGMYRWWLKNDHTWKKGILAGAGHGGIESIILGILVMLTFINLMAYRNADLNYLNLAPEKLSIARQQIQMYWSLPWYDSLLGALGRTLTMPFHIAASVLVLQVFTRNPARLMYIWLGIAILYHAILDASIVFIASQSGVYAAEAFLAVSVVLDIIIIFTLRQPEPEPTSPLPLPNAGEPLVFTPTPVEETSDNLEKTRYQ
jgi:uncharacterized membrane protein YhfC